MTVLTNGLNPHLVFSQNATGPNSVCEGSDVTLQCRVMFSGSVRHSVWFRNGTAVRVGNDFIPNHFINFTNGYFTDLVITDVTMADNNTVYTCNSIDDSITSSVVLNVSGMYVHINNFVFVFYAYMYAIFICNKASVL